MVSRSCLKRLAGIEKLRWVRFLYAYPNKITGRLLETIAAHEKICSYMDVPLQHASPCVLKRMKRGGGADVFLRSIERMRRVIPESLCALPSSWDFLAKPRKSSKNSAILFAKRSSTGWEPSRIQIRRGPGHTPDKKLAPREIERRRKHLMSIQRQISKRKKKH